MTSKTIGKASFRYARLPEDLKPLMALYRRFYAEAIYKDYIEWDDVRATTTIELRIKHHIRPHVLAIVDEKLVGFICWELDHSFSKKPVAMLFEFYVEPRYRRSAIGRFLLRAALWVAKDEGACAFHAPVPPTRVIVCRRSSGTSGGSPMHSGLPSPYTAYSCACGG